VFGPPHSKTSVEKMEATYKYIVKSHSYIIGKLVEKMGIEHMVEYDKNLFKNHESSINFAMKIRRLAHLNVQTRVTCAQEMSLLMDKTWYKKPPKLLFHDSTLM